MPHQFLIVNNGMTGLRGHYYETAVSVAEEARRRGCRVRLAAHGRCPADGLPDWLTFAPLFRVDHFATAVADVDAPAAPPSRWAAVGAFARRLLPPPLYLRLRAGLRSLRRPPAGATIDLPSVAGADRRILNETAAALAALGQLRECRLVRLFHDDLRTLLRQSDAGPDDVVFLPTAHGREVLTVRHLLADLGGAAPRFHLELRHAVSADGRASGSEDDYDILPYSELHRVYFAAAGRYPPCDRLHLHTDTDELAAEYAALAGVPFGVLPIPFRAGLIPPRRHTGPTTLLFLGDCRRDKGFHLLPGLVEALADEPVRWVLQATRHPSEEAAMAPVIARLQLYPDSKVRLLGAGTFLAPEAYYQALADADVVLCPYRPERYRLCSSGVFAEAVAAGKPTVVPAGTWLAGQQPPGAGETFGDPAALIVAVRRLCHDLPRYQERARRAKDAWLARHSPARLVDVLLRERPSALAG